MDSEVISDNTQSQDDSGTTEEILDGTVSRIWYSVSSFPAFFWNLLCWQLNPLIRLYYVIVTSLDGSRGKQRKLIYWLEAMSGRELRDLQAVWEDGSIVCDVINAVMIGNCEPKDHHGNCLRHAQELASHHFKLLPVFSNSELQKPFSPSLEKRLWRYLLSLRNALKLRAANNIADQDEKDPEYLIAEEYVARGMGLILACRGERAIFFVYSRDDSSLADIHIHIKGPNGDCGEATAGEPIDSENHSIVIDYRLTPDYLKVCYIPQSLGHHELSLTRHSFNIPGSPFIIKVGEHTGPPSEKFTYLEWLTEEQEEERRLEVERKRNLKVVSRVIDFITEKMHMTDDGILVKFDESLLRVPSPARYKRTGRSLSPRPRCKLSSQKRSKSLTNQKLLQAAEFLKLSTSKEEEIKLVQDAASQVSEDFSMIHPVGFDLFQEKCQRIVRACDFLLSHAPKQKSLEILSAAEKILDIPYNSTLTYHKSSFELYRPDLEDDIENYNSNKNIKNNTTESSRSSETDDEKEVIKSCTPEINVTRVDFSDRLYSMRKFDDVSLNAVSSFNNDSPTNVNISTSNLDKEKERSESTSPQKDAKMARKSFKTVGYTKAKRTSESLNNISDELHHSDIQKDDAINSHENEDNTFTEDENHINVPVLQASEPADKNTQENMDFEHSSKRLSRSREPKLTRNSKTVRNLVKKFENESVCPSDSIVKDESLLSKDVENNVVNNLKSSKEDDESINNYCRTMEKSLRAEISDGQEIRSNETNIESDQRTYLDTEKISEVETSNEQNIISDKTDEVNQNICEKMEKSLKGSVCDEKMRASSEITENSENNIISSETEKGGRNDDSDSNIKINISIKNSENDSDKIASSNSTLHKDEREAFSESSSQVALEIECREDNREQKSLEESSSTKEIEVTSSIRSRISAFENYSRKNVTDFESDKFKKGKSDSHFEKDAESAADNIVGGDRDGEIISKINPQLQKDIEPSNEFEINENDKILGEDNVIKGDAEFENKTHVDSIEELANSDSIKELGEMDKIVENVTNSEIIEKISSNAIGEVGGLDDQVGSELDSKNKLINDSSVENLTKESNSNLDDAKDNTLDEDTNEDTKEDASNDIKEECALLSVKHSSFNDKYNDSKSTSRTSMLDEEDHKIAVNRKHLKIDESTPLIVEEAAEESLTGEYECIKNTTHKDENFISEIPVENTQLNHPENLIGKLGSPCEVDNVVDKDNILTNKEQDAIDSCFVSELPPSSVNDCTTEKELFLSENDERIKFNGQATRLNMDSGNINGDHLPLTEPNIVAPALTDIGPVNIGEVEDAIICTPLENNTENYEVKVVEEFEININDKVLNPVLEKDTQDVSVNVKDTSMGINEEINVISWETGLLNEENYLLTGETKGEDGKVNDLLSRNSFNKLENKFLGNSEENSGSQMKEDGSEMRLSETAMKNETESTLKLPHINEAATTESLELGILEENVITERSNENESENFNINISGREETLEKECSSTEVECKVDSADKTLETQVPLQLNNTMISNESDSHINEVELTEVEHVAPPIDETSNEINSETRSEVFSDDNDNIQNKTVSAIVMDQDELDSQSIEIHENNKSDIDNKVNHDVTSNTDLSIKIVNNSASSETKKMELECNKKETEYNDIIENDDVLKDVNTNKDLLLASDENSYKSYLNVDINAAENVNEPDNSNCLEVEKIGTGGIISIEDTCKLSINIVNEETNTLEERKINICHKMEIDVTCNSSIKQIECNNAAVDSTTHEIETTSKDLITEKDEKDHSLKDDERLIHAIGIDEPNEFECLVEGEVTNENVELVRELQENDVLLETVESSMDLMNIEKVIELAGEDELDENDSNKNIDKLVEEVDSTKISLKNSTEESKPAEQEPLVDEKSTEEVEFNQEPILTTDNDSVQSELNVPNNLIEEKASVMDEVEVDTAQENLASENVEQYSCQGSSPKKLVEAKDELSKNVKQFDDPVTTVVAEKIVIDLDDKNVDREILKEESVEDIRIISSDGKENLEEIKNEKVEASQNKTSDNEEDRDLGDVCDKKMHEAIIKLDLTDDEDMVEKDLKNEMDEVVNTGITTSHIDEIISNTIIDSTLNDLCIEGDIPPNESSQHMIASDSAIENCGDLQEIDSSISKDDELLLVIPDIDVNISSQVNPVPMCTVPDTEASSCTIEANIISQISKEAVDTVGHVPQTFEFDNCNAESRNINIDSPETCYPQSVFRSDKNVRTRLLEETENSLENEITTEHVDRDESVVFENAIEVAEHPENYDFKNGLINLENDFEELVEEECSEEKKEEEDIHEDYKPSNDNQNTYCLKEINDTLHNASRESEIIEEGNIKKVEDDVCLLVEDVEKIESVTNLVEDDRQTGTINRENIIGKDEYNISVDSNRVAEISDNNEETRTTQDIHKQMDESGRTFCNIKAIGRVDQEQQDDNCKQENFNDAVDEIEPANKMKEEIRYKAKEMEQFIEQKETNEPADEIMRYEAEETEQCIEQNESNTLKKEVEKIDVMESLIIDTAEIFIHVERNYENNSKITDSAKDEYENFIENQCEVQMKENKSELEIGIIDISDTRECHKSMKENIEPIQLEGIGISLCETSVEENQLLGNIVDMEEDIGSNIKSEMSKDDEDSKIANECRNTNVEELEGNINVDTTLNLASDVKYYSQNDDKIDDNNKPLILANKEEINDKMDELVSDTNVVNLEQIIGMDKSNVEECCEDFNKSLEMNSVSEQCNINKIGDIEHKHETIEGTVLLINANEEIEENEKNSFLPEEEKIEDTKSKENVEENINTISSETQPPPQLEDTQIVDSSTFDKSNVKSEAVEHLNMGDEDINLIQIDADEICNDKNVDASNPTGFSGKEDLEKDFPAGSPIADIQDESVLISNNDLIENSITLEPSCSELLESSDSELKSEKSQGLLHLEPENMMESIVQDGNMINIGDERDIDDASNINLQENITFEVERLSSSDLPCLSGFEPVKSFNTVLQLETSSEPSNVEKIPEEEAKGDISLLNKNDSNLQEPPLDDKTGNKSKIQDENINEASLNEGAFKSNCKNQHKELFGITNNETNLHDIDNCASNELIEISTDVTGEQNYIDCSNQLIPIHSKCPSNANLNDDLQNISQQKLIDEEIKKCDMESLSEVGVEHLGLMAVDVTTVDGIKIDTLQDFKQDELKTDGVKTFPDNLILSSENYDLIQSSESNEGLFDKDLVDDLTISLDGMDTSYNNMIIDKEQFENTGKESVGQSKVSEDTKEHTTETINDNKSDVQVLSSEETLELILSDEKQVNNLIEIEQETSAEVDALLSISNDEISTDLQNCCDKNYLLDAILQTEHLKNDSSDKILENNTVIIKSLDEVIITNSDSANIDLKVVETDENEAAILKEEIGFSSNMSKPEKIDISMSGDSIIVTDAVGLTENCETENISEQNYCSKDNDMMITDLLSIENSFIETNGAVIQEDASQLEMFKSQSEENDAAEIHQIDINIAEVGVNIIESDEQIHEELKNEYTHLKSEQEIVKIIDFDISNTSKLLNRDEDTEFEGLSREDSEKNINSAKQSSKMSSEPENTVEQTVLDKSKTNNTDNLELNSDLNTDLLNPNDTEELTISSPTDSNSNIGIHVGSRLQEDVENEFVDEQNKPSQQKIEQAYEKEICSQTKIEEEDKNLELIDINNDSISVHNEPDVRNETTIIDSSLDGECIESKSSSTFLLSELSLGRQETFLLVNSSKNDSKNSEKVEKSGVQGLIERFSNTVACNNESEYQPDTVKFDSLSEKEKASCYETGEKRPEQSNKLSKLIQQFESNKSLEGQYMITDENVKVVLQDHENMKEDNKIGDFSDQFCQPHSALTENEDGIFPPQHEFDLCSIGSNDDDVVSKSYTDINHGNDESLTKNENFGSTEHLLLCVDEIGDLRDGEIQLLATDEGDNNSKVTESNVDATDVKFNDKKSETVETSFEEHSSTMKTTETQNHEIDHNISGIDNIDVESPREIMKRYGTSNNLMADLIVEEDLIKCEIAVEKKSLELVMQENEFMNSNKEDIVKGEVEPIEHISIGDNKMPQDEKSETHSKDVKDSTSVKGNVSENLFVTQNDLLVVGEMSDLPQDPGVEFQEKSLELAMQENEFMNANKEGIEKSEIKSIEHLSVEDMEGSADKTIKLLPPTESDHTGNDSASNEMNENPVESRDVCYEILNEISNEKSKGEEESLLKTSISDKQGTDSTGSELNRSISLIVNSSLESDYNFCSNLQDDAGGQISECMLDVLMSNNEQLESIKEPERDSMEDIFPTQAGEACAELDEKQVNEDLTWLNKKSNKLEESASLSSFNLWPSSTVCGPSGELNSTAELSEDIDFDSIISAPSLDEALKKFEKRLSDKMSREITNVMEQSNESEVSGAEIDAIEKENQEQICIATEHSPNESNTNSGMDILLENVHINEDLIALDRETSNDNESITQTINKFLSDNTSLQNNQGSVSESNDDENPSHTEIITLQESFSASIDVHKTIEHPLLLNESLEARPQTLIDHGKPCVDAVLFSGFPSSRPSSRMEMIKEELEEINDNIVTEEINQGREERLTPLLDSDDVSVSDISECLEKFDSLIQETELHDNNLLNIDESMLIRISVTDCDSEEPCDNILTIESEIPECDRIISESISNDDLEYDHQLSHDSQVEIINKETGSNNDNIVDIDDIYEIHCNDSPHDKNMAPNLKNDSDLVDHCAKNLENDDKVDRDAFIGEVVGTTIVPDESCKKRESKPRKSLVKSKKMFWDEKLKSLQVEQENKSRILIEKKAKTVPKHHVDRMVDIKPTLKITKSINQQCNQEKLSDTTNKNNDTHDKKHTTNDSSNQQPILEEPIKIVVEFTDKNDDELVEDRKTVDNWKNYWNNLMNEKDEDLQAMRRQPSIRVQGIVASSRTKFEKSASNLERSVSCEILTDKGDLIDNKSIPARSVGENLNRIGLETLETSFKCQEDRISEEAVEKDHELLQKLESISNISERIKFFEKSSIAHKTETTSHKNIEMAMNLRNKRKCSIENTSVPCSPTTIKIGYFDDNQEPVPYQLLKNNKIKSESIDSSDGDVHNPLTMTLSGRIRSFSTGKIEEVPDSPLSNIEKDRSVNKDNHHCLEKSDSLCEESKNMCGLETTLHRAKSEGNLSMNEKITSRARFEQAKCFFKCLEKENLSTRKARDDCLVTLQKPTRSKQISMDSDSCGEGCKPKKKESKYRRRGRRRRRDSTKKTRSAPTSDSECRMSMYENEFGGSERQKSKRVSERFHVKHLFRDISGDSDGIFKGIPNRKAVLASLEDLRADSVPEVFDCEEPSRSHSLSSIPSGYQDEYPYLPTTPPSQYRHRSQLEDRFITRCRLVTYEMEI